MTKQTVQNNEICPRDEIGLYLDGELSAAAELDLERHLAVCPVCLEELNCQKEMLLALDFAFDQKNEIELPADFTRVVVAKAESGVTGLRSKKECSSALFLSLGLFSVVVVGLGAETTQVFGAVNGFGRHVLAVVGFFVHLMLDVATGAFVILRSLSQQVISNQTFLAFAAISVFFIFALTISHLGGKFKRF